MNSNSHEDHSGKRFTAGAIDYTIILVFCFVYLYAFGSPNAEGGRTITGLPAFGPIAFWFVWLVLPEFIWGTTLGHLINGLKIISEEGEKPSFSQAVRRRLCDPIEITWCFGLIAFILIKNTQYNQRLGDIWGKTFVVDKSYQHETTIFEFEQEELVDR